MELRAGYKQTDIGVIPEDWGHALCRDVLHINRGRVISHREIARNPGPYPVYSSQTKDNGVMGYLSTFSFEGEYITWTTDGANAGTVFYRTGRFNCTNVCGAGKAKLASSTTAAFFAYYLDTVAWKHVSHVGNPKLMSGPFGSIPVVVPPAAEQRAIAAALSDADALIASLDALIAKKRDLKQAAMQQLLTGKTRLPGFAGKWEVKRLGDLAQIIGGGTPKSSVASYWDGGILWCTPTDITGTQGKYLGQTERTISAEGLKKSAATLLSPGSLLLCTRATIGELKIALAPICTNQGFKALICHPGISNEFMYYLLLTMKQAMTENSSGSTFLEISKRDLSALKIKLPRDSTEQAAIAEVLSDMDAELASLEGQLDKARALKQGMMQELLTGRIRLI